MWDVSRRPSRVLLGALIVHGCGDPGDGVASQEVGTGSSSSSAATDSTATTIDDVADNSTTGTIFDLGGTPDVDRDTDAMPVCTVVGMDAPGTCRAQGPPDSFEPELLWTFGEGIGSFATPLVGNFTDDNADGNVDLCDVPDVLLVGRAPDDEGPSMWCRVILLDGATGGVHYEIPTTERVACPSTPAFGDIDGDGLPEIVALWEQFGYFRLKAFEHDGTPKWTNTTGPTEAGSGVRATGAIALHDLDADGDVEIVFDREAYDQDGNLLWEQLDPEPGEGRASFAVDLDADDDLEVVVGNAAYHHDGAVFFDASPTVTGRAIAQVGDFDADPNPELLLTSGQGLWMLEHDGSVKYGPVTPLGEPPNNYSDWQRPATIHDIDGNGAADWASSQRNVFTAFASGAPVDVLWQAMIDDDSGSAGATAFDFLGDGVAELVFADESALWMFDGQSGDVLIQQERHSPTSIEYPTVADVDNDGSADILVVSDDLEPALQVFHDIDDRWVPARRIWNQHAYFVTNVREDSTIPQFQPRNWETLNTFRAQAQVENGSPCEPAG